MLAYWSAMTLLNALKDVTDEVVGNYFPPTLHHLLVAALKLAPLVLGPDAIYQYTVRPFFEQHEEEMDAVIKRANVKAQEVKADLMEYRAEIMHAAAPMMEKVEHAVSPTLEQVRGSLIDTTHRVEHALGLDKDREKEKEQPTFPLTAEDAVKKDEELTLTADSASLTGLRQRSKQPTSFTAASTTGAAAAAPEHAEIERAKQNGVLVEKIVWGHGLSAKQDEYQRQLKQKDGVTTTAAPLTDGSPEKRPQHAAPPPNTPTAPITQNVIVTPSSSSAMPQVPAPVGPPVLTAVPKASHPPLSAFPLPSAVLTAAPAASAVTDTKTTTLLDSRSIPSIAFMDPNLQKEL